MQWATSISIQINAERSRIHSISIKPSTTWKCRPAKIVSPPFWAAISASLCKLMRNSSVNICLVWLGNGKEMAHRCYTAQCNPFHFAHQKVTFLIAREQHSVLSLWLDQSIANRLCIFDTTFHCVIDRCHRHCEYHSKWIIFELDIQHMMPTQRVQ